jgi:hypothetical protein
MDAGRLRFGMKILRRKMAISLGEENAAQLDTLTRGTKTGVAQFHSDPISRNFRLPNRVPSRIQHISATPSYAEYIRWARAFGGRLH